MYSDNDCGFLWYFIKFIGIDVLEDTHELPIREKCSMFKRFGNKLLEFLYPMILHFMQIYAILGLSVLLVHGMVNIKETLSFFLTNWLSLALWHDIRRKKKLIGKYILSGNNLLLSVKESKYVNIVINLCLFLAVAIPIILGIFYTFVIAESSREYKIYYSIILTCESDTLSSVLVRNIMILITFSSHFMLPSMTAILLGSLYCKVSNLLTDFNGKLVKFKQIDFHYDDSLKLMNRYNLLFQLVHSAEQVLSSTSFLLLCSQWLNVYIVLVAFFKMKNESFSYALCWENITRLILGPIIVASVVACASRISLQSHRIRMNMQLIHNFLMKDSDSNHKTIQLVQSMTNTEFPHLTAFKIAELKPGLILTFFGSVLTYGLLVLNIKKE
ncbi:hypothetical protein AVEN_120549-1 [Araneus ventricosus]|uniref:Gustatory receptor n=1 Tax=Araneus ventricosus TaxID=182803 RepID=A0A4Y2DZH5_ARAVE|nr:hypothetical protein AVEN_20250-1 [Araneus ventricosus]GBM21045.1 hypothetical protein AVEN_120549-1 [Araneus ventricosus]